MAFADDWDHWARHFPVAMARGWRDFLDDIAGLAAGGAYDYDDISGEDDDTDVTGAELEELTDGSETVLHIHSHTDLNDIGTYTHLGIDTHITSTSNPHTVDYSDVSTADAATDVTAAELEELTDGSETTLHPHASLESHGCKVYGSSATTITTGNWADLS